MLGIYRKLISSIQSHNQVNKEQPIFYMSQDELVMKVLHFRSH